MLPSGLLRRGFLAEDEEEWIESVGKAEATHDPPEIEILLKDRRTFQQRVSGDVLEAALFQ